MTLMHAGGFEETGEDELGVGIDLQKVSDTAVNKPWSWDNIKETTELDSSSFASETFNRSFCSRQRLHPPEEKMAPVLLVFALLFSAAVTSIQAEVPEYCNLDPEVGMCRGFFRMYFFNETSKHCEEFIYGGCGGNSNRFDDLSHCKITCIGA